MKAEEVEEVVSPSSSPPTPPSPLPVSVGPGNSKYYFSSSPSASPPFSPPTSAPTSTDNLPLISGIKEEEEEEGRRDSEAAAVVPSAFSLSSDPPYSQYPQSSSYNVSTCLQDILEWFALRCCSCCSLTLNPPKPHQS